MAGLFSWLGSNWFSAVQTVGIIAGLWFTAVSFRGEKKAKEVSNILALVERHRVLWGEAHQREDLKRIFLSTADVVAQPPSVAEAEFLRLIILHFETGWWIEKSMRMGELKSLGRDARDFFSLPLPRLLWEETKQFRNQQFVRFVERALRQQRPA